MSDYQQQRTQLAEALQSAQDLYDRAAHSAGQGDKGAEARLPVLKQDIRAATGRIEDLDAMHQAASRHAQKLAEAEAQATDRTARLDALGRMQGAFADADQAVTSMVDLIRGLGEQYEKFTDARARAREELRLVNDRRWVEQFATGLGASDGADWRLAGLMFLAGLNPILRQRGEIAASEIRRGKHDVAAILAERHRDALAIFRQAILPTDEEKEAA